MAKPGLLVEPLRLLGTVESGSLHRRVEVPREDHGAASGGRECDTGGDGEVAFGEDARVAA